MSTAKQIRVTALAQLLRKAALNTTCREAFVCVESGVLLEVLTAHADAAASKTVIITKCQAERLQEVFLGDDKQIVLQHGTATQPAGLYASSVDHPEEGATYLGPGGDYEPAPGPKELLS